MDRARGHPVLWVTGPPGAGKTTLVAGYLEARRLRCLWYQVDRGDADLAAFFYHMGLAVAHGAPRTRRPMPLLTPEYQGDPATFARTYFRELFRRLAPPFALVFDDYQEVAAGAPLHAALREGLAELPRGGRFIVLSRALPPPPFARLRARGLLGAVRWDALRFSLTEWQAAARLSPAPRIASTALRELHRRMDGWIAGLVLAAEGSGAEEREGEATPRFEAEGSTEAVFDYFAEEVLRSIDSRLETVLLQTAILPRMTPAMAARLTGSEEVGRLLSDVSRRNYFIQRQAGPEPVYQYHPLFRDFLLAQARRRFTPIQRREVNQRAAALLVGDGEVEPAVSLFLEAGDAEGLSRLLLEHARSLVAQGRSTQLERWLSLLPPSLVERTPWLQYWYGVCQLPLRPEQSQGHFESAFRGFEQAGEAAGLFLAWAGVVDSILYHWGDCTRLDPWIAALDGLMRRHPEFPSPEVELRVATSMAAALLFRQPHHEELRAWADRAVEGALVRGDATQRMLTGYYAVCHRFWTGDQAGAATLLDSLRNAGGAPDAAPLARIMWHTLDAIRLWHQAATDACLETVAQGQAIAEESGVRIWDFQLVAQGVFAGLTASDLGTARGFLERMARVLATGRRLDVSLYHYLASWEAILALDVPRARDHAEQGLRLTIEMGTPFPEGLNRLSMAQVLHEAGQPDLAAEHLGCGQAIADRMRSAQLQFIASATAAHLALDRGDDPSALAALRQMAALGRRHGIVNTPWWRPRMMAHLCQRALGAGIEVAYLQDLIRRRGLVPDEAPVTVEAWPWPVRISTMGSFAVLVDDRPIAFARKTQQKPLALLKAVVALGGRAVGEDQLVDALWADAEGDAAHHALRMTLHRLRKLLGHDRAVVHQGGRVSLDPFRCWLDTWALERRLDEADTAARRGDRSAAWRSTEAALALYRGPFLDREARLDWAIFLRERLRGRILRALGWIGDRWAAEGEWGSAAELYERGLAVETLAEPLYRGLMTCQMRLGRPAEALATYRRCRAALAAGLGVVPSPATEALHRSLLAVP
jgi:DNA-binding SARP family transcriptional activator